MFANLPLFLSQLAQAKAQGKTVYQVDEQYLTSLRGLVQDVDARKQWLGYLLIAKTLDVHSCAQVTVNPVDMGKHLNTYIAQISQTLSKSELFASLDQSAIAMQAWLALVQLLHSTYDQKAHASVLTSHKQVMQLVFKKVEKAVKSMEAQK
jgi:hypothetical protein